MKRFNKEDYTVGWLCAVPIEKAAALAVLDEEHETLSTPRTDTNSYTFGRVGEYNVVIGCLPAGLYGTISAATVVSRMQSSFLALRFWLMVGIGGGVPSPANDIRLGDVVIGQPGSGLGGIVHYDFGKTVEEGELVRTGFLNAPPSILLSALSAFRAINPLTLGNKLLTITREGESRDGRMVRPDQDTDRLFRADYKHIAVEGCDSDICTACESSQQICREARPYNYPYLHFGLIASGNQVMKDSITRDKIGRDTGVLCFEMEAAGIVHDFPCLVIRGICDYSDSHKNKRWQPYAALAAAAAAKELLRCVKKDEILDLGTASARALASRNIEELNVIIPFKMPLPRNREFTGREEELMDIHGQLSRFELEDVPRVYALTGTGGMGKTQISIEYAYRHQRDYTSIFWIFAMTEDTIRASIFSVIQRIVEEQAIITWPDSDPNYGAIGRLLAIPGLISKEGIVSTNPKAFDTILSALFRWLQLPNNSRWLLLFDNADDLEAINIEDYIPKHGRGAVIITSRRPEFSRMAFQIDLDGLDVNSAVQLLLRLAHITASTEDIGREAEAIVRKLGFMPLAISHAGCFISETKSLISEYISYYDDAFGTVQSKKPRLGWNYRDDTAVTTWEISFSQVEKQDETAAWMLLTCSYLNPEEIFDSLWENEQSNVIFRLENKNRISLLASYSLVRMIGSGVFSIHPVVHAWARERLEGRDRLRAMEAALMVLGEASERNRLNQQLAGKWDGQEEERLAAHSGHLNRFLELRFADFVQVERQKQENVDLFNKICDIALVVFHRGKYHEAMQWYERALAVIELVPDRDHESVMLITGNIASVFQSQGEYDEAMQWNKRGLAYSELILGRNHLTTLTIVSNIASIFYEQSRYDEAMQWYGRAFDGMLLTLPENHPPRLTILNNIALVLQKQDKHELALRLHMRILTELGADHGLLLGAINNIAAGLSSQGKYDEAMELYE